MYKQIIFSALFLFILAPALFSQEGDKAKIEQERQDLQKEIREIEGMYSKVQGQTKQSLSQLNLIQRKLNVQNRYLSNISRELRFINDDLYLTNMEIYRLQKQLDTLKTQYAKSVVYAYKNRGSYNFLNFIFSANGFNDALKRIAYLKSYRAYREQQVQNIYETQKKIAQRRVEMLAKKDEQNKALTEKADQAKELEMTKKEQSAVVSKLRAQQKDLQKELTAKKKRDRDLKNQIDAIVRREIEAAKREAEKKAKADAANNPSVGTATGVDATRTAAAKSGSYLALNAEDIKLNEGFENNKGRLPWPVDNGKVKIKFGKYEYQIAENSRPLVDYNPGITISTPNGNSVKAIFEGEVASVTRIADEVVVVIRHGKYFTVYSNLSSASVSNGAKVSKGQVIGRAGMDDDGSGGKVDFMVLIEKKEQNPELWLRR